MTETYICGIIATSTELYLHFPMPIKKIRTYKRKTDSKQAQYHENQKLEAAKLYIACGSPTQVATALGISRSNIHYWMRQDWWNELMLELRTEGTMVLNSRLKNIVEKGMDVVMDRLQHGDFVYNPETKRFDARKPVSMKDVHKVTSDYITHSRNIEKSPIKDTSQTQDKLALLAETFANLAKKTTRIEVIDAIPNERQARLQEGAPMGVETPQTERTTGGENGGPESGREEGPGSQTRQQASGPHSSSIAWREQLPDELESGVNP